MDMSSNSQLVKFYTLFFIFADIDRLFIKLNFLHVTIKVGEGGGYDKKDMQTCQNQQTLRVCYS